LIAEQFNKAEMKKLDLLGAVVYQAFGASFSGKHYKPLFEEKKETPKTKRVSKKEREENLKYLKERFAIKGVGDIGG
jgi:hypothetical protein